MIIASHELKGKIQTLKQPFVVMKPQSKRTNSESHGSNKRTKVDADTMDIDNQHDGYEVAGIVTSKILFNGYPKSIMKWFPFTEIQRGFWINLNELTLSASRVQGGCIWANAIGTLKYSYEGRQLYYCDRGRKYQWGWVPIWENDTGVNDSSRYA